MPAESIYRDVPSMEPLMPEKGREILADLTAEIFRQEGWKNMMFSGHKAVR